MKQKISINLLGIYDLILALGSIYIGTMMILSRSGIFTQYPEEWLSVLPFKNWVIPGIITIVMFGMGNIIAAISSISIEKNISPIISAVMGGILFICLAAQIIILKETYLATAEFLILSIIQLYISGRVFMYRRRYRQV